MSGTSFPQRATPMRVIVCGVHRTGSMSMRVALRQLGFNDCYHMVTVGENMFTHPQMWVRAIEAKYAGKGTFTKEDWDNLLGGAQACVDLPAAFFSAELAELYPEAKVVILNRDPEKWYDSVLHSVSKVMWPPGTLFTRLVKAYLCAFDEGSRRWEELRVAITELALGYDHGKEKDKAIAWYNRQYQEFRDRIPEERRIEFKVQDGWGPLCTFLEVPVPTIKDEKTGKVVEVPFPRVNDRDSINKSLAKHSSNTLRRANDGLFSLVGRLAMVGAMGYGGYMVWKTRLGGRF